MSDRNEILSAIGKALPEQYQARAIFLVDIIDRIINQQLPYSETRQIIEDNPSVLAILSMLSGKNINTSQSVVSFGKDSQFGDITIRDVSGRDIINITLNIADLSKDQGQQMTRRLVVISSPKQVMELRSAYDGLELHLHDITSRQDKGLRWKLSLPELRGILRRGSINVRSQSDQIGFGFFDIGARKNWYYSHSLFPKPIELHSEIRHLIEAIVN